MGRKLVLTGTKITDLTAPRLITVDPLESSGSLLLMETSHPAGAWAPGVPANGATLPNLFASTASSLLGSTESGTISVGGWTGGRGIIERSAKGGLHAAVSPTLATTADFARLRYPAPLRAYILANQSHRFYFSSWTRTTRAASDPAVRLVAIVANSGQMGANYLYYTRADIPQPGTSEVRRGTNVTGPRYDAQSVAAWTGTPPAASEVGMTAEVVPAGYSGFAYDDTRTRATGGAVFYRHYVEDLTVSGRSAAEVDALDHALYRREVLEAGGRYYGDTTPTNATTIA